MIAEMTGNFKLIVFTRVAPMMVVEDEPAASDAAIHVVGGSWDKQAWVSWHEIAPMRGRDNPILLSTKKKATMRQCEG
jgi:ribosome biogenesis protein Tsr3